MFLQSISVYFILILFMMMFAFIAAKRANSYTLYNGNLVAKRSFWKIEVILPILFFAIIMGMRYDVGYDYISYLDNYLYKNYTGKGEVLFNLFSDIGWYFNLHYTVYFTAIAFVQILFFFLAFKDERYLFPFLIFFLFTSGNYLFLMNVIRQALALCIWLYALKFIDLKKPYIYFFICVLLFMIHRSSVILFIFYPLLRNGTDYFKSIKLQLVLFFSAFIIRDVFSNLIMRIEPLINFYTSMLGDGLYDSYNMENLIDRVTDGSGGSGIAMYFKIGLHFLIILYSARLKKYFNSKRFIIIYFFFFLGLLTTYIFPEGAISLTRPFRYFYIFQPIMYAYFLFYLYKNKNTETNYILFYGIIVVFLLIFVLSQYMATEDSHSLYQFYFQKQLYKEYPN